MKKNVAISVVILTKNSQKYLERQLDKIFSQDINERFEVICVDSHSKDSTEQICRERDIRFYKIRSVQFNHGLTRNFVASLAKGEFIIFISQDAFPSGANWLKDLVGVIRKDKEIAGVYCRQIPRKDSCFFTRWQLEEYLPKESRLHWIERKEQYERLSPGERYRFCQFDDVCSCIRKSVWEKFNFKKVEFGEDIEWSKRVLEAGYKIAYYKEAAVIHSHKLSLIDTYRRAYLHHKLLCSLFGYRVFSSFLSFLKNLIIFPLLAIGYCIKKEKNLILTIIKVPRIAILSIISVFGQYFGSLF